MTENLTNNDIFPDIDKNTEYQKLLASFKHSGKLNLTSLLLVKS